mmetsp:Transcript_21621/g.67780  ORF Transcript_21621/g.67780 Transcript_21621/m.67780 type:complete len:96 (-) Transcript_21621:44-331(-)
MLMDKERREQKSAERKWQSDTRKKADQYEGKQGRTQRSNNTKDKAGAKSERLTLAKNVDMTGKGVESNVEREAAAQSADYANEDVAQEHHGMSAP